MTIESFIRDLLISVQFLTRLPVRLDFLRPRQLGARYDDETGESDEMADVYRPEHFARAMWAFPLVGALGGLLIGNVMWILCAMGLPLIAAAALALALYVAGCGALHEDGLADFFDGLGGRDRDHALAIMRDSHLGTYGVVALVLTIGLKIGLYSSLLESGHIVLCVAAAAGLSRAMMVLTAHLLPPARNDGLAAQAAKPDQKTTLIALGLGFAIVLPLGVVTALLACALAALGAGLVAFIAQRRLGGHSGDVLGAVQQLAEVFTLIGLAIAA